MLDRETKDRVIRVHIHELMKHLRDTNGYTRADTRDEEGYKASFEITQEGELDQLAREIMSVEISWVSLYKGDTYSGGLTLLPYEGRNWDGVPDYADVPELDAALKGFLSDPPRFVPVVD